MSWPRWTCASKISASAGSRLRSSSSYRVSSACARSNSSSTRGQSMQRTVRCRAVPDVLIFSDTETSAEMRHEVPITVPDPFLYAEKDGKKMTAGTAFEVERIKAVGIEAHALEEFGYDELLAEGRSPSGRDRAAHAVECMPRVRHRRGSHPVGLPDVRRRPPACERDHAHARFRLLLRTTPCEERCGARRDPQGPGRGDRCHGRGAGT